ncbi:hypothetical protein FNH22_05995 [Fulvivirga sp. M361]|uniref:hypothetical protein n=1 Tax=Fulvivirga sp. M361 TaxID=2594266 RepID=UPI00117B5D68|nr:hypothetical protein [Fulvivirga sp. M361]TRX60598.1 hypothetical protein FNH22_05995 [Fulvivirga sp. M361]
MKKITFWQYFKLNKTTTFSCLKICSIVFAGIATTLSFAIELSEGIEQDPLMAFLVCELIGYTFAAFIFILAIIEGYVKARLVIGQFNRISAKTREDHSIEILQRPLNSKYWFIQFQIVQYKHGEYYELDGQTEKEILTSGRRF